MANEIEFDQPSPAILVFPEVDEDGNETGPGRLTFLNPSVPLRSWREGDPGPEGEAVQNLVSLPITLDDSRHDLLWGPVWHVEYNELTNTATTSPEIIALDEYVAPDGAQWTIVEDLSEV